MGPLLARQRAEGPHEEGLIERLHDPAAQECEYGRWRWKPEAATQLSELRQAAEATATAVTQSKRRGRPHKSGQPSPELA